VQPARLGEVKAEVVVACLDAQHKLTVIPHRLRTLAEAG
jgi:hypothetical protein